MDDRASLVQAAVLLVLSPLLIVPILRALRRGEIADPNKSRNEVIDRTSKPVTFWIAVTLGSLLACFLLIAAGAIAGGVFGLWDRVV